MGSGEPLFTISGGLGRCSDKSVMSLLLLLQLRPRDVPAVVLVACCFYSSSRLECSIIIGAVVTSQRCGSS